MMLEVTLRAVFHTTMSSSAFLDQYEPLDVIGNYGSFEIIRKVRRKTDGVMRPLKYQKPFLRV